MLGVRRQHQAVDVVVFVDAIDALVCTEFGDAPVAIPDLAVLGLALFVAAVDGIADMPFGQLPGSFQPAAVARFHDRAGVAGHVP